MPSDSELIAQTAKAAESAKGAAESVAASVRGLAAQVAALRPRYMEEVDHALRPVWIVLGGGALRVHVLNGDQMGWLLQTWPGIQIEQVSGANLRPIPVFGSDPTG